MDIDIDAILPGEQLVRAKILTDSQVCRGRGSDSGTLFLVVRAGDGEISAAAFDSFDDVSRFCSEFIGEAAAMWPDEVKKAAS